MNSVSKIALALTTAGALSFAAITPSMAQDWRPWAAAGAGFVAGAAIASAANNHYYAPSYGYAAEPYYYDPGPTVVVEPTYTYRRTWGGNVGSPNYNPYVCSTDEGYGRRSGCDR